ncbi:glycosyltransferase [Leptolyngbya sp. FACHB-16]|uniref:glycosyltransferase n=1 Tax=unclassified Leptolyngbya TaxID=2650499 RepID=UPI001688D408|nr:glycosyltransferase [Leptolyngbya sp. FACHB-16]MBD2152911.1 glycosyltransferase family 1 protein [Leptolyngbya sp. FACHB-16]
MQRILFIGYTGDKIVTAQQSPFLYHSRELRQLRFEVAIKNTTTFAEGINLCLGDHADSYFLMPSWREKPDEVEALLNKLRKQKKQAKIFFVDPFAQSTSCFLNVLPYVDGFMKRQRYRDRSLYTQNMPGGSLFTQYLVEQQNYDLGDWYVGSIAQKGYESNITTGWSLGTSRSFKDILQRPKWLSRLKQKKIDIFCRMSLGKLTDSWYYKYRQSALDVLTSLNSHCRIVMNEGSDRDVQVPQQQYFRELQQSRIVFSPFGWGESCWRDFEAVCYSCLLLKPSMEHLDVEPNLFIPGETYVPLAWDFSDFESKCQYYLENPEAADAIIRNARQAYLNYFKTNRFVTQLGHLMQCPSKRTDQEKVGI